MPARLEGQSRVSNRRQTLAEARFPKTAVFHRLLSRWTEDASLLLLQFVWRGYDYLKDDVLDHVDARRSDEDLERSITQLLEPRVRKAMTGDEPFDIQHGSYEHETRQVPPAQPPQYDLAFVLRANPRVMWPLEAKIVRAESDVHKYVSELKNNFLTCRYAPFSNAGAMLGYALCSTTDKVFKNISKSVPCRLRTTKEFGTRPHRYSSHLRAVPIGKQYPCRFRCYHLLFVLTQKPDPEQS